MKKLLVLNNIKIVVIIFASFFIFDKVQAQLNGAIQVSGKVTDERQFPLDGISVLIKGTTTGAVSDSLGNFKLITSKQPPFTLVLSGVGFSPKELNVKSLTDKIRVQLFTQTFYANEVVVTASRQSEKVLRSPVAIEKLDIRALK